jgi:hypothetical protein
MVLFVQEQFVSLYRCGGGELGGSLYTHFLIRAVIMIGC